MRLLVVNSVKGFFGRPQGHGKPRVTGCLAYPLGVAPHVLTRVKHPDSPCS